MAKQELWIEKLDDICRRAVKQWPRDLTAPADISVWRDSRTARIHDFRSVLAAVIPSLDNLIRVSYGFKLADKQELRWAIEQFGVKEYQLIELCYGKNSNSIYLAKYTQLMRVELNNYLVRNDREALGKLFNIGHSIKAQLNENSSDELVQAVEIYETMIDEAWASSWL